VNFPGIYIITNLITSTSYVGSTSKRIDYRISIHKNNLSKNKHVNNYLQNAWNKYGEENFEFSVLEKCIDKDITHLLEREQYWIDYYRENFSVYNIRLLASSNTGCKMSEERKENLRKFLTGRPRTEETKEKLRKANLGKKYSSEVRAKVSAAGKGRKPSALSNKLFTERVSRNWKFTNDKGEIIEIYNLNLFCRENNLSYTSMLSLSRGNIKSHKGWTFGEKPPSWTDTNSVTNISVMMGQSHTKLHKFINPEGLEIEIYNLNKFCRENGLSHRCMLFLRSGHCKQHKGWTFKKE